MVEARQADGATQQIETGATEEFKDIIEGK